MHCLDDTHVFMFRVVSNTRWGFALFLAHSDDHQRDAFGRQGPAEYAPVEIG